MKILHTSDWHLGHSLYNYDRTEEQTAMLRQMVEIVAEQKPDVFLLCGDVYHTPQPSAAVQTMFTNALMEIHEAYPQMTIVITAGNHDSGTKHEIFRTPWKALKVHTLGTLNKDRLEEQIIKIDGQGYIIAIPYAYERNIPEGWIQQILDLVSTQNTEGLPIVLCAHTTVKGCEYMGHEHATDSCVGGIDALDLTQMGNGYDYLALGHIHRPQFIHTGHHNVRYCGSPLAVSFDEQYAHSVSLVEIGHHGEKPNVSTIEIDNPHPLVTLPCEGTATWETAKSLLKDYPADIPAYIRLNVEIEDFLPVEAHTEAALLTEGKRCRFCHINALRPAKESSESHILTVQEFQAEDPMVIAQQFAKDTNILFDDDMKEMFQEAMASIHEC